MSRLVTLRQVCCCLKHSLNHKAKYYMMSNLTQELSLNHNYTFYSLERSGEKMENIQGFLD